MNRADIYALIDAERDRQEETWSHPHDWGFGSCASTQVEPIVKAAVLAEECGEVARAVLDNPQAEIMDGNDDALRAELVQVAAVAVAWLESFPVQGRAPKPMEGQEALL